MKRVILFAGTPYHVQASVVVETINGLHQEGVESDMLELLGCDFLQVH